MPVCDGDVIYSAKGNVKKVQTAKKRKNIENTMVSMSVNISTKERKTQKKSFSVKFSFLLQTEPRRGEMRPQAPNSLANLLKNKIRPRRM